MEYLPTLLFALFCPIVMGLMMWLLMRRLADQLATTDTAASQSRSLDHPNAEASEKPSIAALRAQLRQAEAQQAAMAARLAQLSAEHRPDQPLISSGAAAPAGPTAPAPSAQLGTADPRR